MRACPSCIDFVNSVHEFYCQIQAIDEMFTELAQNGSKVFETDTAAIQDEYQISLAKEEGIPGYSTQDGMAIEEPPQFESIIVKSEETLEECPTVVAPMLKRKLNATDLIPSSEYESSEDDVEYTDTEFKISSRSRRKIWKKDQHYICDRCNKVYRRPWKFLKHFKQKHIIECTLPFKCKQCTKKFATKIALEEHETTHLLCSQCPRRFQSLSQLKRHEETHTNMGYLCPKCGLKLNTKQTLKTHMLVHEDARKYMCQHCSKTFKRVQALSQHLLVHTGLRPHVCPFCGKTFTNRSNLKSHKRSQHPEETAAELAAETKDQQTERPLNRWDFERQKGFRPKSEIFEPETDESESQLDLEEAASDAIFEPLLPKSREKYERSYKLFEEWCHKKKIETVDERVLVVYYSQEFATKKPSTTLSDYSMLKATMKVKRGIDIGEYRQLMTLLKRKSDGYKSKKSKAFTRQEVARFILEADDDEYLAIKVRPLPALQETLFCSNIFPRNFRSRLFLESVVRCGEMSFLNVNPRILKTSEAA